MLSFEANSQTLLAWCWPALVALVLVAAGASAEEAGHGGEHGTTDPAALEASSSRLTDEVTPMQVDLIPERPRPLLEIGEPFLGTGPFSDRVITLPGGAVWRPSLLVFGSARTAVQSFDSGDLRTSEWASRVDLFANLQLSGTERAQIGLRPVDNDGRFLSYLWDPDPGDGGGWRRPFNINIETAFFEGDLGEMLPFLDQRDRAPLDLGFAVGRQPLLFQDGMLINDIIDSVGLTRNTLTPPGFSNLRVTGLFGWDEIHRGDNRPDDGGSMAGLFTEMDVPIATLNFDSVYIESDPDTGDALFLALSSVQRIGHLGSSFRVLTSIPFEGETSATGRGTLLFAEFSYDLPHGSDFLYGTAFWAIDQFSSAARDPNTGGPLGRAGILFDAVGLGTYGSPLSNATDSAAGGSVGAQFFFDDTRRQLILEAGGRTDTGTSDQSAIGFAARIQQALGTQFLLSASGYVAGHESRHGAMGGRVEFQIKF